MYHTWHNLFYEFFHALPHSAISNPKKGVADTNNEFKKPPVGETEWEELFQILGWNFNYLWIYVYWEQ